MIGDFEPGDRVRAKLWPELGVGEVLDVTKPVSNQSNSIRVAEVQWPDASQRTRHSFAALKPAEQHDDSAVAIWYCATSGEIEQRPGGGFDVCCMGGPSAHVRLTQEAIEAIRRSALTREQLVHALPRLLGREYPEVADAVMALLNGERR